MHEFAADVDGGSLVCVVYGLTVNKNASVDALHGVFAHQAFGSGPQAVSEQAGGHVDFDRAVAQGTIEVEPLVLAASLA